MKSRVKLTWTQKNDAKIDSPKDDVDSIFLLGVFPP